MQTINPPGSEVGPGQVATWGRSDDASGEGFGFKWTAKEWLRQDAIEAEHVGQRRRIATNDELVA